MLKRKITDRLTSWKNRKYRKPLIIEGARQVGKTFSVRDFADREYDSFIELNFYENENLKSIFEDSLDARTVIEGIRFSMPQAEIKKGSTLLFLDEIQECPRAITSLKFLSALKEFDVIASGSALGMAYGMSTSFPVGYVEYLDMHSLDFEEFLWAMGVSPGMIENLKNYFTEVSAVPKAVHERMLQYLKQYLTIGGMPEIVSSFSQDGDWQRVDENQKMIIRSYVNDIAHYARPEIKIKAENCYRSIPHQLAKNNHKFQYSKVEKRGTKRKFESSLDWLVNSNMAIPVSNVSAIEYPLDSFTETDNIRLYPNDIGLLTGTYDISLKKAILSEQNLDSSSDNLVLKSAKGGLYEALAADILSKKGYRNLHFYRNRQATVELEFLIENSDGVIPIEVKAGKNRTKSLDRILESENIRYGYKFCSQNTGKTGKKITMPMYMMMFL